MILFYGSKKSAHMEEERNFPVWEDYYHSEIAESMPWYYEGIDPDIDNALKDLDITCCNVLDLGTGPGTQAIALSQRGFKVIATDLSGSAITIARKKARALGLQIDFMKDDILESKLDRQFDVVFDRGLFHVISPERRKDYVITVQRLVKEKCYLFLKCFSHLETYEPGPYRFSPGQIREYFRSHFTVISSRESIFHGTLNPPPRALFNVLQKN